MIVIPSIDILDGRVVKLIGGRDGTNVLTDVDPLSIAKRWEREGAQYIHIVDLNRAWERGNNFEIIKEIVSQSSVPVEVGGGIRSMALIKKYISAGAEYVVLGTKAIINFNWLKEICDRYPDKIVVALDVKNENIMIKGWRFDSEKKLIDYAKLIDSLDIHAILYTDINAEGRMKGINTRIVKKLLKNIRTPLIVAGGVESIKTIRTLSFIGVWGVIVGMGLYSGKLNPKRIFQLGVKE